MVEKRKYKRKLSNMLNYFVLCEYQMLIHTKVGIFMCWNGRERIESKAQMEGSLLNWQEGRRKAKWHTVIKTFDCGSRRKLQELSKNGFHRLCDNSGPSVLDTIANVPLVTGIFLRGIPYENLVKDKKNYRWLWKLLRHEPEMKCCSIIALIYSGSKEYWRRRKNNSQGM